MGQLVQSLFGGKKDNSAELARQREMQQIAQNRQEEQLRAQEQDTASQTRATGRAPRGRRLLLATEDGGLANTLGG